MAGRKDKSLEERVKRLENYFWIAFTIAGLLGISGAFLIKQVTDAHTKAAAALEIASKAETRLMEATEAAITEINGAAAKAVAAEAQRQVAQSMDGALKQVRAEIPTSIDVTPATATNYGGRDNFKTCGSGVASGVSLGTTNTDVAASCSTLTLKRGS